MPSAMLKGRTSRSKLSMKLTAAMSLFVRIGARIRVHRPRRWQQDDYQIDVGSDRAGEFFDFSVLPTVDFQRLQSRADQRHLLLLASDGKRFLCGHDERHWFGAGIADRVSTVAAAKESLMPAEVLKMTAQIPRSEIDNRKNVVFKHAHIAEQLNRGVPPEVIVDVVGHSDT